MSKRIKKVISLVLIFMIAMLQTLSTFAASGGGNKFEIVDSEYRRFLSPFQPTGDSSVITQRTVQFFAYEFTFVVLNVMLFAT